MSEVEQVWEVPHPDDLTLAEIDEVMSMTGIDVQNADAGIGGKVLAALVTWTRRRNGETVTFDDVYRTFRGRQVRMTKVDPTAAPPPA